MKESAIHILLVKLLCVVCTHLGETGFESAIASPPTSDPNIFVSKCQPNAIVWGQAAPSDSMTGKEENIQTVQK